MDHIEPRVDPVSLFATDEERAAAAAVLRSKIYSLPETRFKELVKLKESYFGSNSGLTFDHILGKPQKYREFFDLLYPKYLSMKLLGEI